ncbi:MAG TPA: sulfite exporter TauE/SafE family protein [Solirubrobacterales bacterium]|nr:sulfite exporter TauE/SafE family protein [Solirubrobacterales bacterium]
MARDRMLKLAAIGSAAGVFSGVFGVGGGSVVVPLLILWFGYSERAATGTSLAAIGIIAVFAAIAQAVYGNVDLLQGLVVGTPAVAGVVVGTGLQQRVPERTISLLFAGLLVVIAIQLVIP